MSPGRELLARFVAGLADEVRQTRQAQRYGTPRRGAGAGLPARLRAELYGTRTLDAPFTPTGPVGVASSRRPEPGYLRARPAGHGPRWSPVVPLVVATQAPSLADGLRLRIDGLRQPAGPVPVRVNHRPGDVGFVEQLSAEDFRLVASVRFDLHTAQGRALAARSGPREASVGMVVLDQSDGWVTRWELDEVSVLTAGHVPADPGARTAPWMLAPR